MEVKKLIKNSLIKKADRKYLKSIDGRLLSFDAWIRLKEQNLERFDMTVDEKAFAEGQPDISKLSYGATYDGVTVRLIPYSNVDSQFKIKNYIEDILIFVNGELTDKAIPLLVKKFKENASVDVVYGDEDIAELDVTESNKYGRSVYGTRRDPFFKPEWSPNAFLDHFYFGNVVAVRRSAFREVEWDNNLEGATAIYNTLLKFIFADETHLRRCVDHIDEILVHAKNYEISRITDREAKELAEKFYVIPKDETKISVVIPSKNNPDLLENCLTSLKKCLGDGIKYEVIVVDNGSDSDKKILIEKLAESLKFKYIYEPSEFNFAKMINHGVEEASNDLLLILNDDITFDQNNAIQIMADQAKMGFVGAVGAKLLYPGTTTIQHAGVFNNRIGPVHKLQFQDDSNLLYHGLNKSVINTSAVTAACMMVRKDLFLKVKGMNESLKVAFNDIDFCFKLLELGYVNVECNNISMEHAESITRGKDTSIEKLERLNEEKERLYELHPALKGYDPYFSKYLLNDCLDVRMTAASDYEYKVNLEETSKVKEANLTGAREDSCVQIAVEFAGTMEDFSFDAEDGKYLYLQGFAYVIGTDNACYKKALILKSDDECCSFDYKGAYRNDVALACSDQVNVELSGFAVKLERKNLKPGRYRVGVMMENTCAREKLYAFSNKTMIVR